MINLGIIGLGQCGGNIANCFSDKYTTLAINTSEEDLNALTKVVRKYHIANSRGASKDQEKAYQLIQADIQNILKEIHTHFANSTVILLTAGLAGGTGSTLIQCLADILTNPEYREKHNMSQIITCAVVMPDERKESSVAVNNAYKTLKELNNIQGLGNIYILDNKRHEDKHKINQTFCESMDWFISVEHSSVNSNLDEDEKLTILATHGFTIINKLSQKRTSTEDVIKSIYDNIYCPIESNKAITYMGLSLYEPNAKLVDKDAIIGDIGKPFDDFIGFNDSTSLAVFAGLSMPNTRIAELKAAIKESSKVLKQTFDNLSTSIFDEEEEDDDLGAINSFRNNLQNRKTSVKKPTNTSSRDSLLKYL